MKVLYICILLLPTVCRSSSKVAHRANLETLKVAQVIFRHGDRTPIKTYPNDPYGIEHGKRYWPQGWGQLTSRGKMQQFLLGQFLKQRYNGFLDTKYSRNEVFIQSSNVDRTIMSAQVNLAGLFPPQEDEMWNPTLHWQPIPVHTIPTKSDNKLDFLINCSRYKQERELLMQYDEIKEFQRNNQWLYSLLTNATGMNVNNFDTVGDLYDTLFVQSVYNLSLPEWSKNIFPEKMKPLAQFSFQALVYTIEMQRLRGGPLLKDLIGHMDLFTENVSTNMLEDSEHRKAKLYLYSGHDSTIAALLTALGVFEDAQIPPYASAVIVELHKNDENPYFIKVYYRNNSNVLPYELQVPGCENPCTLLRLKHIKQHLMVHDWEEECATVAPIILETQTTIDNMSSSRLIRYTGSLFSAVMVLLILGFLATLLLLCHLYGSPRGNEYVVGDENICETSDWKKVNIA